MIALALAAAALVHAASTQGGPSGFVEVGGRRYDVTAMATATANASPTATANASPTASASPTPTSSSPPAPTAPPTQTAPPCRAERSAYLRHVLRSQGIEVDDPLALLAGLAGGESAAQDALLFSPHGLLAGFDPLHPLAWDAELRSLGRDLERCVRDAQH